MGNYTKANEVSLADWGAFISTAVKIYSRGLLHWARGNSCTGDPMSLSGIPFIW